MRLEVDRWRDEGKEGKGSSLGRVDRARVEVEGQGEGRR